MPRLLFISFINFVQLLFESGDYSRAVFILLSQSLRWCRREQSNIEWLLDRQENLLIVADWFTSLFWVCFVSSRWVFVCTCYSSIHHTHCGYYSKVVFISFSTRGSVAPVWERLLIESGVWSSGYRNTICTYTYCLTMCLLYVHACTVS